MLLSTGAGGSILFLTPSRQASKMAAKAKYGLHAGSGDLNSTLVEVPRFAGTLSNALLFANDQAEVLERMKSAQVTKAVVVATEEAEIASVLTLARENDGLYAAFAVSPQDEALPDLTEEEIVLRVQDPKMVAVGETGLDYHYCQEPLDWQRNRFATHIRAANLANKPLIIHSREAACDTLDILKANGAQNCGFVLHCFCGDWDFAKKALDLGGYLSFSGIVTFRSAQDIQEVARKAPDDRIFIETDSPYLAPVPLRGKRNEPSFVPHVAQFLAQLRGKNIEDIAALTMQNANRFFRI